MVSYHKQAHQSQSRNLYVSQSHTIRTMSLLRFPLEQTTAALGRFQRHWLWSGLCWPVDSAVLPEISQYVWN